MNHFHALPVNGDHTPVTHAPAEQPLVPAKESEPGLLVSRASLRFDRTEPGEESFRILKITPPSPGTPVTLSTDLPDSFQMAVGVEQLLFAPTLTFTPEAGGTYVHLRYKPKRTGRHQAQLVVQTQHEKQIVPVSGRTGGLAGVASAERSTWIDSATRWLPKLLIGASLVGFSYAGYINRCTLFPSLCQQATVTPLMPEPIEQVDAPAAPIADKKQESSRKPVTAKKTAASRSSVSPEAKSTTVRTRPEPTSDEPAPVSVSNARRAEAEPQPAEPRSARVTTSKQEPEATPKSATRADEPQISSKPTEPSRKPTPQPRRKASEESELERVLNKKEDF